MHPLKMYLFINQIKQVDFAKELGISKVFLSRMLKYESFPSQKTAMKIVELTNEKITMNDLFYPKNYQNKNNSPIFSPTKNI